MYLPKVLVHLLFFDQLETALEDGEGNRNMFPLQPGVAGAVVSHELVHKLAGIQRRYRDKDIMDKIFIPKNFFSIFWKAVSSGIYFFTTDNPK